MIYPFLIAKCSGARENAGVAGLEHGARHRLGSSPGASCLMHTTPVSLLQRLRKPGEEQAWQRFTELYTPLLYYWTRHLGLQAQDAADLVQEVFTVLVEKLPEFAYDRNKSFRNWLRT